MLLRYGSSVIRVMVQGQAKGDESLNGRQTARRFGLVQLFPLEITKRQFLRSYRQVLKGALPSQSTALLPRQEM